jgi:hypothetical protein
MDGVHAFATESTSHPLHPGLIIRPCLCGIPVRHHQLGIWIEGAARGGVGAAGPAAMAHAPLQLETGGLVNAAALGRTGDTQRVVSLRLDSIDSGFPFSWLFLLRDISEWLA